MSPYPTISTVLSASAVRQPWFQRPSAWSPTNPGMPRSDARVSVTASSAVEALWMPRPLQSSTPSGIWLRMWSTPAVSVCTTLRRAICANTSPCSGPSSYDGT